MHGGGPLLPVVGLARFQACSCRGSDIVEAMHSSAPGTDKLSADDINSSPAEPDHSDTKRTSGTKEQQGTLGLSDLHTIF